MGVFTFIDFYAEKIGKHTQRFTKQDWMNAALTAARFLDELVPVPKRPGRPRKKPRTDTLAALVRGDFDFNSKPKQRRGRPAADYGGLSAESLSQLADDLLSPQVRRRWPKDAPKSREQAIRQILRSVKADNVDPNAAARAERRFRTKR